MMMGEKKINDDKAEKLLERRQKVMEIIKTNERKKVCLAIRHNSTCRFNSTAWRIGVFIVVGPQVIHHISAINEKGKNQNPTSRLKHFYIVVMCLYIMLKVNA
ncbi:CLUMA_CG014970, isoform A [Clunio marinus]|uniref:CLUMA_CG014970, isoform A n=1 Tax=Clunio marinus TaxID=568069 RepID=A0A1J1IPV6_9DIPT|nr:CLUMA_CG014970, isoform A [Clunio marinus]